MLTLTENKLKKIKNIALSNGDDFHVVAVLVRKKSIVKIKANAQQNHPKFKRVYKDKVESYQLHAEMNVLRFSRPGDIIYVFRFLKDGTITMAKPCVFCQGFILKYGIKEVYYSDWNGNLKKLTRE